MKRIAIVLLVVVVATIGLKFFVTRRATENAPPVSQEQISDTADTQEAFQTRRNSEAMRNPSAENTAPTNLLARILAGEFPGGLTAEQAEAFVTANKRSAESLLVAYRETRDANYLREAMEKFPDDPKVNFVGYFEAVHFHPESYTTEERRAMLERLTKAAPENSLGNYLAASDYFKSGESDKALEHLKNVTSKRALNDYSAEFIQNAEEAYRQVGYSDVEAKMIAGTSLLLPHLAPLKQAGAELSDLATRLQQGGDETQAREARQLALHLADMLQDGSQQKIRINQLVGIAIEKKALANVDPNSPYDSSGKSVQTRLDELAQSRKDLNANVRVIDQILMQMPPADQSAYYDRLKIYGETATMKWAVEKYGN